MNTIDWNVELNNAIKTEPTEEKFNTLLKAASGWVTCAVGTQCKSIPRNIYNQPLDQELYNLGKRFYTCIYNNEWINAKKILEYIERESAEIIIELQS